MLVGILITIVVVVLLGSLSVAWAAQRKRQHVAKMLANLNLLHNLKILLIYIQQHRGLTTGYLHGDQTLDNAVRQAKMRVDNQWQIVENVDYSITEDQLFEGISTHWKRLSSRWKRQSVTNNIEQHNRLIINLLYLIENKAESYTPMLRFGRDSGLDVIWKELLETIEAIGQTRAIGMGVVSAGESTTIERIQLKFLVDKVSARLEALEASFTRDSKILASKVWAVSFIDEAKKQANDLLVFIDTTLLTSQVKSVSPESFFDLASAAISPLDQLFVEAEEQMKQHLDV